MMIAGIALTAITAGKFLDPYSHARLLVVVAVICAGAVMLTALAVWGIERRVIARPAPPPQRFRDGIADIWADTRARHFTFFVFLSMTAYFMQELILEPYAGLVFNFTPGQSTRCRARRMAACSLAWCWSAWPRRACGLAACAIGSWPGAAGRRWR